MPNNTLSDLNNHLFAQLERLSDEGLNAEELAKEIERSKAVNGIAKNVIDNAKTALEGMKFKHENLGNNREMPEQFKLNQSE